MRRRLLVLAGQDFGVGQPRVIVDSDVQMLPADVPVRFAGSFRMRLPTAWKRPSFFVSTCKSSPGRSRS